MATKYTFMYSYLFNFSVVTIKIITTVFEQTRYSIIYQYYFNNFTNFYNLRNSIKKLKTLGIV
jgi:hypothetical protein